MHLALALRTALSFLCNFSWVRFITFMFFNIYKFVTIHTFNYYDTLACISKLGSRLELETRHKYLKLVT